MTSARQVAEVQRRLALSDGLRCHLCGHVADTHWLVFHGITCRSCPDQVCQVPPESECR